MKVLHLLAAGGTGGIEVLCKNIIERADWIIEFVVYLMKEKFMKN